MADDYYLKIDGVQGESTDQQHPGEIQLESWSFGESNPVSPAPGGAGIGAGKVHMQDFRFVTRQAHPQRGAHLPQGRRHTSGFSEGHPQ